MNMHMPMPLGIAMDSRKGSANNSGPERVKVG